MNIIIKNLQNNKGLAPYEARGFRSGFVILFAVTLASILLAIALGVTNIALKEIKFGTNARDTNDAFFAADTGIEKILFDDKNNTLADDEYTIPGLGSNVKSCAIVTVDKTTPNTTIFTSKGYNIGDSNCASPNQDRIEREIIVTVTY